MANPERRDPAQPDRRIDTEYVVDVPEERRVIRDRRVVGPARIPSGRRATDKVACPFCGDLRSKVLPKHPTVAQQTHEGFGRRRRCDQCGKEFPTLEVARIDLAPEEKSIPDATS
jgi:hypothetical protein